MPLLTNLVAYWKLDEASGTRNDSHTNALHLTDINTVGSAAGKIGNAANFVAASSERLERANEAALRPTAGGYYIACWLRPVGALQTGALISEDVGADRCFSLILASNFPAFYVFNAAGVEQHAQWGASLAADTWYFLEAWWDPADSKVRVCINLGTPVVSPGTITADVDGAAFAIGGNVATGHSTGQIDEVGLWIGSIPTNDERAELYNGGLGLTYEDFQEEEEEPTPTVSVRESILANVKTTMQGIAPGGTPAAGYLTPIKGVYRWGVDSLPSAMEAPLILVLDGGDAYDQSSNTLLHKRLTVAVEGWQRIEFEDDSTVAEDATTFLADMERAVLQDIRRGGYAVDTLLKASEVVIQREAEPLYVVTLVVEIRYRTNLTNPSSQTP